MNNIKHNTNDGSMTTGASPNVSPSKEKAQVLKLRTEKKDLEDDIKRLKIMAFKIKSDMVFNNATNNNTKQTDDDSMEIKIDTVNNQEHEQQLQQAQETKEKYYHDVTASAATAARKRKSKSSFPSLSASQISYNHYPNFPRMALKEENSTTASVSTQNENNSDKAENSSRIDDVHSGNTSGGDEYCQIDDIYSNNINQSKKKNTNRQSTRYYNKDGLIIEPNTDEVLQQTLRLEAEEAKEKQRKLHVEAICQAKNEAIHTIQLFNKNLNFFKNKFNNGFSCHVWEGESIIHAPMVIKLDPRNNETAIKFEQTTESLFLGYFSTMDIPRVLRLCDVCDIFVGADIADDIYANTNNNNNNSTVASSGGGSDGNNTNSSSNNALFKTSIPTNHQSRFLSIVSKGDGDVISRRLALELSNIQERNMLISGIRTLISELHMVHMYNFPDKLLQLPNSNINISSNNSASNHQNNASSVNSQLRLDVYNKNHKQATMAAALTASSSSSSVILNKQRSKSRENSLLLQQARSRNASVSGGTSYASEHDDTQTNVVDIANNANTSSSNNNSSDNKIDTARTNNDNNNSGSGYNIRSSIISTLSEGDYYDNHHNLHHNNSNTTNTTLNNDGENDDVIYNLTHSTSHNKAIALNKEDDEEEEEEVCEWRNSEDFTNMNTNATSGIGVSNPTTTTFASPSSPSKKPPQSLDVPITPPSTQQQPQQKLLRPKLSRSKSLTASPSKNNSTSNSNKVDDDAFNNNLNDSETFLKFDGKAYTPNSTQKQSSSSSSSSSTSFTGSAAQLLLLNNKQPSQNRRLSLHNRSSNSINHNSSSGNSNNSSMMTVINGHSNRHQNNHDATTTTLNSAFSRSHSQTSHHSLFNNNNNSSNTTNKYIDNINLNDYYSSHESTTTVVNSNGSSNSETLFDGQLSEQLIERVQRDKLLLQMLMLTNDIHQRDEDIVDSKSHEYLLVQNLNHLERMYQQEIAVSVALTHRLNDALRDKEEMKELLQQTMEELNAMKLVAASTGVGDNNITDDSPSTTLAATCEKWDGRVESTIE